MDSNVGTCQLIQSKNYETNENLNIDEIFYILDLMSLKYSIFRHNDVLMNEIIFKNADYSPGWCGSVN